jgi:hypothetical protein
MNATKAKKFAGLIDIPSFSFSYNQFLAILFRKVVGDALTTTNLCHVQDVKLTHNTKAFKFQLDRSREFPVFGMSKRLLRFISTLD